MATDKMAKTTEESTSIAALQVTTEQLAEIRTALDEAGIESMSAFSLPRIKVPAASTPIWMLPDDRTTKELDSVIVTAQKARQYYEKTGDDEDAASSGTPPTCASHDGKCGKGNPGGNCAECPLAAWADDAKPLCKERRHMLLLVEGSVLPVFLNLPPSSVKNLVNYQLSLVNTGVLYARNCVTRLTLDPDKNAAGQPYCKVKFSNVGTLTPEQRAVAANYSEAMRAMLQSLAYMAEDAAPAAAIPVDDYVTPARTEARRMEEADRVTGMDLGATGAENEEIDFQTA